jgi:acetolactate decarboxylase
MKHGKRKYLFRKALVILCCCLLATLTVQATEKKPVNDSTVVQVSIIQALLKGIYDSDTTFKQLKQFGDFGFGTLNGLDGEMIALEGQFYQAQADGSVHLVTDSMKTPYATVHFFQTDQEITLTESIQSYEQLQSRLDQYLPSRNRPYGLKITGTFDYLKVRSVPKQNKPYPPVVEVVTHQPVFEWKKITGTLVGYWFPDYMDKLNVPGYHLHFISADKQQGGHLLDCRLSTATIDLDWIDSVKLLIPQNAEFQQANLTTYSKTDLEKVENNKHQ